MMAAQMAVAAPLAAAPAPGPLAACRVVITMPDGSRGVHNGYYYDNMDALNLAAKLFPEAKEISVCGGKARVAS